jgi:hypothetical protein
MMSGGVVAQYSPIIGDVIEPPSYMVNLSLLQKHIFYSCFCNSKNIKHLTKCKIQTIQNEEILCQSVDRFVNEYSKYNLFHFYRVEEIQVM